MEDRFLYSELEDTIFIMIEGNATMKNSKTLSDLLKKIFDGEKKNLVFEMSNCNYLDSTFLGLIAKCALEIKKKWNSTLYIMNASNMVMNGLKQTGIDKFIEKLEDKNLDIEGTEIEKSDFSERKDKTLYILEMHKTLVDLNDKNKETFKNVVDMIEKDLEKQNK